MQQELAGAVVTAAEALQVATGAAGVDVQGEHDVVSWVTGAAASSSSM